MKCIVTYQTPEKESKWNQLCLSNSNFVQSTHYDSVSDFFHLTPIYFQIINPENELIAGVKLYFYQSRFPLLKALSRRIMQFGEVIYEQETHLEPSVQILEKEINQFIQKNKIVEYVCDNYYGGIDKLIKLAIPPKKSRKYVMGFVDLENSEIPKDFNRNTKRNILKGEEAQLVIQKDTIDFFYFIQLIYKTHLGKANPNYIRHYQEHTKDFNASFYCYDKEELVATVFDIYYGKFAYSSFGRTLSNDVGAGQFMYAEVMQQAKNAGYHRYYFGQLDYLNKYSDKKSEGISIFKRGFRCIEIPSEKNEYIVRPFYHFCWKLFLRMNKFKNQL